jgi:hypothetical protein
VPASDHGIAPGVAPAKNPMERHQVWRPS